MDTDEDFDKFLSDERERLGKNDTNYWVPLVFGGCCKPWTRQIAVDTWRTSYCTKPKDHEGECQYED